MRLISSGTVKFGHRDGVVLFAVLGVLLMFSALGVGWLNLGRQDAIEVARLGGRVSAFWNAEAGYHAFRAILEANFSVGVLELYDLADEHDPVISAASSELGFYDVYVTHRATFGQIRTYDLRSVGRGLDGSLMQVNSIVRLRSVAENVWSTHTEGSVWFNTGDILNGPARTNGRYRIRGTPLFLGEASSVAANYLYRNVYGEIEYTTDPRPEIFTGGLNLGDTAANFESDTIEKIGLIAGERYEEVDGYYSLTFLDEAYALARYEPGESSASWVSTNLISDIGDPDAGDNILYFNAKVVVRGAVDGRVSVASSDYIQVDDDLVYSSAPDPDYNKWSDDFELGDESLGLFSGQGVQIDYPDDVRYGKDVNIHAAVYVTEGASGSYYGNAGFYVVDWRVGINQPSINLYGSIVQHTRGAVGTTGGGGYRKSYHGDSRFVLAPPPGTPYDPPEYSSWSVSNL